MRANGMIGCCDVLFGERLRTYLIESKQQQLNIDFYTELEHLMKGLQTHSYDVIVLEEALLMPLLEEGILSKEDPVLVLTESRTQLDTTLFQCALKYQEAGHLERLILDRLLKDEGKEKVLPHHSLTRLVGVMGPVGGSGTTTIAQLYAQIERSRGKKVLFHSLDFLQAYEVTFHALEAHTMSDYMVYLLTHTNWLQGLDRMIAIDDTTGVHYLKPVVHQRDLDDFEPSIWVDWLDYMVRMSDYDLIVVELSPSMKGETLKLLSCCHSVMYVYRNDIVGRYKWNKFLEQLKTLGTTDLPSKQVTICNQLFQKDHQLSSDYDLLLSYDPELLRENREGLMSFNPMSTTYKQMERLSL